MPEDHARLQDSVHGTGVLMQDGLEPGMDSEGGQGARAPLSDHTAIIKFSGPVLTYFLHSLFSIVE